MGKLHGIEKPQGPNEIEADGDGSVRLCTRLACGPPLACFNMLFVLAAGLWVLT